MGNGPTDIRLMRKAASMRGTYRSLPRGEYPGAQVWFSLTRLSEDGTHAYGYYCPSSDGKPHDRAPLVKLRLNASRTAPEGFRRRRAVK